MRFYDQTWLYLLAAVPFLGLLSWWGVRRGMDLFHQFVSSAAAPRLSPEGIYRRQKIRTAALTFAAALLLVALARPQYGVKPIQVTQSGIDMMILIDTSTSMAARDVTPSRLERAVFEIGRLVRAMQGNRMGLIAFAGSSFVECPLTLDAAAVRMFLDTMSVGTIPKQGTAIGEAIYGAIRAFESSDAKTKAVALVTDGENLSGDVAAAAKAAKDAGLVIFPIGIGSVSGAPVPVFDKEGVITGYKADADGNPVLSRLDVETLREVAELTGGTVYTSQGGRLDLTELIGTLKGMEKTDITSFEFAEYEERYQPVAFAALALLVLEYLAFAMARRCPPPRAGA